LDISVIL